MKTKCHGQLFISIITPIHKGGDKGLPENYRPVALTSHIIKVFEKLVKEDILTHLQDHSLLNETQHGFRPGRATISQLLNFHHSIINKLHTSARVEAIYLDFSKAFDKVNHDILRQKLEKHNITGKLLAWIMTFLTNRKQAVKVDGQLSEFVWVTSGVPQGSVLGPLLFTIMMYDITNSVTIAELGSFADDTRAWSSISWSSPEADAAQFQKDLNEIYSWAEKNGAPFNEKKFVHLSFGKNDIKMTFTNSSGKVIETAANTRDLGVTLSDTAEFKDQITKVVTQGRQLSGWARHIFLSSSTPVMLTLLKSLIVPKLEYCCPLWAPVDSKHINLLESIQEKFTRYFQEFRVYDKELGMYVCEVSYWERLQILKIYSLHRRRDRYLILYLFKILNGLVPNPGNVDLFTYSDRKKITAIRPKLPRNIPSWVKTLHENSFFTQAALLFNSLPEHLRELQDVAPAKNMVDSYKKKLDAFLSLIPDQPGISTTVKSNSLIHQIPHYNRNKWKQPLALTSGKPRSNRKVPNTSGSAPKALDDHRIWNPVRWNP